MDFNNFAQNLLALSPDGIFTSVSSVGVNMLQINIRGMNRMEKLDSLCIFLKNLPVVVDILLIGETWIKENRSRFYNIPGYISVFSCRSNSSGGIAVFIREGLNFDVKANTEDNGLHHIEVVVQAVQSRITIHGIYRPPGFDTENFLSFVEQLISSLNPRNPCFLLGDMNIAVNDTESREVQKYLQLLASYNMTVTNTYCTRPASNNILDHVVCQTEISERITNSTLDCDLSDHCYVITHFNVTIGKVNRTLTKSIVNHREISTHFRLFLQSTNLSIMQPNERILAIVNRYTHLKERFSRTISVEVKVKQNVCPWYNFDIWKLGRISNNLFQRWKRNRNDQHIKDLLEHANRRLAEAKRRTKSKFYQQLFSSNNPKQLWSRINNILGNRSSKPKIPILEVDGLQITNPDDLGNAFNSFFSSVGENVARNLNSDGDHNKFNTMDSSVRSMFLRPASQVEITNIIDRLDCSKATGVDGFPISALKEYKQELSSIICTSFNDSISSGIYPDCLKKAIVYPIFKGGDPSNPTNYRPISVLPSINKIYEKLLSSRLRCFLESTALLYKKQYGFRQGSSTEMAALELLDDVASAVDQKGVAAVIFLDLSKAFDTINHDMLLKKLYTYGIRGIANDLLRSYLSDRQQKVMVSGHSSDYQNVNCGVPQGSNIGPLLFLIYINDIANLRVLGHPRLFADDTAILYKGKSVSDLYLDMQIDMQLLTAYLENNLLSLNPKKTKLMIFGGTEDQGSSNPTLIVNGETIEEVASFKYLGVHIDSKLRWDVHIRKIITSCSSLCGILRKLSNYVPRHVLLKIYYSFIHSRYQYGIAVWGTSYNTYLKDIQVQQNRCIKAIYKLPFLYPTNSLYNTTEHRIFPIKGMFTLRICLTMYKIINNLNLHHNWSFASAIHQYRTRNAHLLQLSGFRTEIGRKRFQNIGPSIYNQLPDDIKNAQPISQFKSRLEEHVKNNIDRFIAR